MGLVDLTTSPQNAPYFVVFLLLNSIPCGGSRHSGTSNPLVNLMSTLGALEGDEVKTLRSNLF